MTMQETGLIARVDGMAAYERAVRQIEQSYRDIGAAADRGARQTQGAGQSMTGTMGRIAETAIGMAAGLMLDRVVSGFMGAASSVLSFSASMEQSQVAWKTLLGSGEAAEAMLKDISAFAAQTPFEMPDIERGAKRLMAMGTAAEDIMPVMKDVGNAVSAMGLGAEGIDRVTLALGQMQAKGKVSGEEMLQLTEAGIPAWKMLADAMGLSVAQVQDLSQQGQIASDTFIEAFRTFSQQNYGDAMLEQSKTFNGAISTIVDQLRIVGATAFRPIFDRLAELAQRIGEFVQSDQFAAWGAKVAAIVDGVLTSLGLLAEGFRTALGNVLSICLTLGELIYEALSYLNPFATHSPSLVSQVDAGVQRILAAYGLLTAVVGPLDVAAAAVRSFQQAAAAGLAAVDAAAERTRQKALAIFGGDVPAAYREAQAALADLAPVLDDLSRRIAEQQQVVNGLADEVATADAAERAQQRTIAALERAMRAYDDSVRNAQAAVDAQTEATNEARTALEAQQKALADAQAEQKRLAAAPMAGQAEYERQIARTGDAINALQLQLVRLRSGSTTGLGEPLALLEDRAAAAKDAVDKLRSSIDAAQERIRDLSEAPIAGMEEFDKQIADNQQAINETELALLRLRKAQAPAEEIDAAEQKLQDLRDTADELDLEKRVKFDPLRRQLEDMAKAGEAAPQTFDQLAQAITDAQTAMTADQAALGPATEAMVAQEAAAQGVKDAMSAVEVELQRLQDVSEGLKLEEAIKFDPLRRELENLAAAAEPTPQTFLELWDAMMAANEAVDAGTVAVQQAQGAYDVENQKLEETTAALTTAQRARDDYARTIELERRNLEDLQASFEPLRDRYAAAQRDLERLQQAYSGASKAASDYQKVVDDIAKAAEQEQKAQAGAGKGAKGADTKTPSVVAGAYDPLAEHAALLHSQNKNVVDDAEKIRQMFEGINKTLEAWDTNIKGFFAPLQAGFEAWGQTMQEDVLPALKPIIDLVADRLQPVLDNLWKGLQLAWKELEPSFAAVSRALEAMVPIWQVGFAIMGGLVLAFLNAIGGALPGIGMALGGIIKVISGVVELAAAIITGFVKVINDIIHGQWSQAWADAGAAVQAIGTAIIDIIQGLAGIVAGIIGALVGGIINFFVGLWQALVGHSIIPDLVNAITGLFQGLWDSLSAIVAGIVGAITGAWTTIQTTSETTWNTITSVTTTAWTALSGTLKGIWDGITAKFWDVVGRDDRSGLRGLLMGTWNAIKGTVESLWGAIQGALQSAWDTITGVFWSAVGVDDKTGLRGILMGTWNSVKTAIETVWKTITDLFGTLWTGITGKFWDVVGRDDRSGLRGLLMGTWNAIGKVIGDIWGLDDKSGIRGIFSSIGRAITGIWENVLGKDDNSGLRKFFKDAWDGIVSIVKAAANSVIGMVNRLIDALQSVKIQIPEIEVAPGIRWGGWSIDPFKDLKKLAYLAEGGIAMQPILAQIGERGPEVVLPLDQLADVLARVMGPRSISLPLPAQYAAMAGATYNQQRTYNLSAQYSQLQSEATLRDDLAAMEMLAAAMT